MGKIVVVGIGPGSFEDMTPRARHAIESAQVVAGYKTYIGLIEPLLEGKEVIGTGMTQEVDRCRAAVEAASAGKDTVVVSSGDSGVYGMAGLVLELVLQLPKEQRPEWGGVLASVSLAMGYLRQGTTLMLLFYAPANWLAFIVYFVVGASCGYVQLRNTETARFVQEENKLLCKRLEFTRKLYQDTLEDKQMFRRQILGRRDSFGKIYAVTQQLDMLQPQEIYRKTVQIMEDVLENHSLTIYRMEKNHVFARLTAASAGMISSAASGI